MPIIIPSTRLRSQLVKTESLSFINEDTLPAQVKEGNQEQTSKPRFTWLLKRCLYVKCK